MNIVNKSHTEKEYRALSLNSYSSLKVFIESPLKFYKQYVLKEAKIDIPSPDMVMGDLIHCLLLSPECFNDKFEMATVGEIKKEANHMTFFTHTLWERTLMYLDEEGNVTREFSSIAEEAYNDTKFDRKGEVVRFKTKDLAKVLGDFEGSNEELWYKQKRKSFGKSLVSVSDIETAERIINELRTNSNTADIVNAVTEGNIVVYNEFPIIFHYGGMDLKCMIDKLWVDKQNKIIRPYDLKVTWEVENFGYNYIKNYYYIQNGVYNLGIKQWLKEMVGDDIVNWTIYPMTFIACHSANFLQPLLYRTDYVDLDKALEGFSINGRRYKGVFETIIDLNWALENGVWNITKENYMNNGCVKMNIKYDEQK